MTDLIRKANNEPFPTQQSANMQQPRWEKKGVITEVVEDGDGFALKVIERKQTKRIPLGHRNVLTFQKESGYEHRVVNDVDGRVAMFESAGWEVVKGKEKMGDEYVGNTSSPGSAVTKPVGHGITGVLMRKRKDWYDEDYALKQKGNDAVEEGLVRQAQIDNLSPAQGYNGISIKR